MSEALLIDEGKLTISKAVANVEIERANGNVLTTVTTVFEDRHADLSYTTDKTIHAGTTFQLYSPIRCKLSKEDDYFVIESEQLDIVGTGKSVTDAEENFAEEFAYIFKRYNELPESSLSEKKRRVKKVLEALILKISA